MRASPLLILFILISVQTAPAQKVSKADSLKALLPTLTSDSLRFETNIKISREYIQSDYDQAEIYINKAMQIADSTRDHYMFGKAYNNKGMLERNRGNLDNAINFHNKALVNFTQINNLKGIADSHGLLGRSYAYKNDYTSALENHLKAYSMYENGGRMEDLAASASNLGQLYIDLNQYEDGKIYLLKGLELSEKTGSKMGISVNVLNLGILSYYEKRYKDALKYLHEAAELKKNINDLRGLATAYMNIGNVYYALKNYKECMKWNDKCAEIAEKLGDKLFYYGAKLNFAKALARDGDVGTAEKIINELIDPIRKTGNLESLNAAFETLSEIKTVEKDFTQALSNITYARLYEDSMMNVEKSKQIMELKEKYDAEKKEAHIRLLQKENDIKNEQAEQDRIVTIAVVLVLLLTALLSVLYINRQALKRKNERMQAEIRKHHEISELRARIARDIHDDIGSSLTRMSITSAMLESGQQDMDQVKNSAVKINASTREIIQNLGEIIWSANPRHDTLSSLVSYIRSYSSELLENAGIKNELNFPVNLNDVALNPVLKRNIFLVIKEALNNIVKHAKAQHVWMEFRVNNNSTFEVTIQDDGIGMEEDASKIFSNGMNNMKFRMEEIGGTFAIRQAVPVGTEIRLSGSLNTTI